MRSLFISVSGPLALAVLLSISAAAQTSTTPSQPQPETAPQSQSGSSANAPDSARSQPKSVDDELGLTEEQKQKIAPIVADENKQIMAVRDDTSLSLPQKQDKVNQIRQAGAPKIRAILTPEQLQKLADMEQRARQQQSGSAPPNDSKPQH